jgi:hypothetical protein
MTEAPDSFHEMTKDILVDGYRAKGLIANAEVSKSYGGRCDVYVTGTGWYRYIEIVDSHASNSTILNAPIHIAGRLPGNKLSGLVEDIIKQIPEFTSNTIYDGQLRQTICSVRKCNGRTAKYLISMLQKNGKIMKCNGVMWKLKT